MNILDAFKVAAAAELQDGAKKQEAAPKGEPKTKATPKTKAAPKSEKPKSAWRDFSAMFDDYLRTKIEAHVKDMAKRDAVFAEKMKAEGKSMKDCLNYIGEHFYRQAEKQRKSGYVGIGGNDEELLVLAVHYYDESDEDLKKELNTK